MMFSDKNWRLRRGLIYAMPAIVKHMGVDYFIEHFLNEYLEKFRDGVSDVREAAAISLKEMTESSSASWVYEILFPTVRSMVDEEYLVRVTMIDALKYLSDGDDIPGPFKAEIISMLTAKSKDTVANIRLRVSQVIGYVGLKFGDDVFNGSLKGVLNQLSDDQDRDVKYFALESIRINSSHK